ncbi:hypothetical protein CM240_0834 [Clostridium bornimense]|uniref:Uncharacterized protein n=1 Tax=Clostridium bornimense TaxID=1216932 RepID=W6RUM3_9CLOT|nr:hypothetical protein [Clostridium bornimense]CDM67998.1 hypothetical protein CM240_0834 [Clostridium bornimense]
MTRIVNPFNKNIDEVYTEANYSCECHCSAGSSSSPRSAAYDGGYWSHSVVCTCSYGSTNYTYNHNL